MDYKLISDPRTKNFKLVKIGSGLKNPIYYMACGFFGRSSWTSSGSRSGFPLKIFVSLCSRFRGFGEVGWVRWEWEWEWDVGIHRLDGVFFGRGFTH